MEILKFDEFVNEDLNFTRYENNLVRFEDRYFYYEPEDDIIYGSYEQPTDNVPFWFSPVKRTYCVNGEVKQFEGMDEDVYIIAYDLHNGAVYVYDESDSEKNVHDYLMNIGANIKGYSKEDWCTAKSNREEVQMAFDHLDTNVKHILIWGDQMVASTFDVIEEN